MFGRFKSDRDERIDKLITRVTEDMEMYGPDSEEYSKLMKHLKQLTKLKAGNKPKPVSRDTMALIGGNILGILVIVIYEQKHVMTSKAFGTIMKPK